MPPLAPIQLGFNDPLLGQSAPIYPNAPGPYGPVNAGPGIDPAGNAYPDANAGPTAAQIAAAQQVGQYDQSIGLTNASIGRLGGQQAQGNAGLDTSATNALNQLLLGRNQGEQAYTGNKQDSATGYVTAKNTIGSQAGSALNGLLRLLGSRGAGGGSAYNIGVPEAVARGATLQRADAGNTFGSNNRALDTNWNNYLTTYGNSVNSVNSQRDEGKRTLQSQIDSNRAKLLQDLADLQGKRAIAAGGNPVDASQASIDQSNALLDKVANAPAPGPINYQTQAYQAPSVGSYTVGAQPTPTYNGGGAGDYFSPYLASLLGKKQPGTTAAQPVTA